MAKQHIFLRGEWIGARDIPTWVSLGSPAKIANSYALFCPHCADIWGKLMHEHPMAYCQVVTSSCELHATFASDATFSVQSPWEGDPRDLGDPATWPKAALAHDVAAICNFYLNHPDKAII